MTHEVRSICKSDSARVRATVAFVERCVGSVTPYVELRAAAEDELDPENRIRRTEKVFERLVKEWQLVGGLLLALSAVYVVVFGYHREDAVLIDGVAVRVSTFGGVVAGIGIASDGWLLLLYGTANVDKLQRRAKDMHGTYFFFCLVCRVPILCTFLSAIASAVFFVWVEWELQPETAPVLLGGIGLLFTSPFISWVVRRIFARLQGVRSLSVGTEMATFWTRGSRSPADDVEAVN